LALFIRAVDRRSLPTLAVPVTALALTALAAYQSIILIPTLFLFALTLPTPDSRLPDSRTPSLPAPLATLPPILALALTQLYEHPLAPLATYLQPYEVLGKKLKNAGALTVHLGWIIFPILTFAAFGRRARLLILVMIAAAIYDQNPLFWISAAAGAAVLI